MKKFAKVATLGLALTFTFNCSSVDEGDPVFYEGETYQTVVIGKQTWMARNLNYAVEGSRCYGDGGQVYDMDKGDWITLSTAEIQANCAKYGRLYNWVTAMVLPEECEENECADQIKTPHQGLCPDGWHISSNEDWEELENYVEKKKGDDRAAAKYLKAKDVWRDGEDSFGFAALPGGFGGTVEFYRKIGEEANWWTSSECDYDDDTHGIGVCYPGKAFSWNMETYLVSLRNFIEEKFRLYSVRCVKD